MKDIKNSTSYLEVFEYFLKVKGYTPRHLTYIKSNGNSVDLNLLYVQYYEWCKLNMINKLYYTKTRFNNSIVMNVDNWLSGYKVSLAKKLSISAKSNKDDEWQKLKKLMNISDDDINLYKALIWKVKKRLITGKKVNIKIPMPVLYSEYDGLGKEEFTRLLCKPLGELAIECNTSILRNYMNLNIFNKMLMVNLYGLEYQNKTILNNLNNVLNNYNVPFKKSEIELKACIVGISSTPNANMFEGSIISNRVRQIKLTKSIYKDIHNIDFLELYREVDHNKPYEMFNITR